MANDYLKKQPTKTEKVLYELAMGVARVEQQLMATAYQNLAIAMALGLTAEQIASRLKEGVRLKVFGEEINRLMNFDENAKQQAEKPMEKVKEKTESVPKELKEFEIPSVSGNELKEERKE